MRRLSEFEDVGRVESLQRLLSAQQAVSACLAEVPPTEQLFRDVLETVCGTLGWSFGTAWQRDGDALACRAVWNEAGTPAVDAFGAASLAQRFAPGRGLPGLVWSEGGPVWLDDLLWDPRMASIAAAQRAGLRSAVVIPLGDGEDLEGVLELFCSDVRKLEPEVMGWLAATGAQLGQYLARWREHAILLSRERALAAAVNGVVIADATRRGFPVVYVNPGFERMTGYSLEEMRGRSCNVLQGAETDPTVVTEITEALAARRDARVTLRNYRKDGSEFWSELHLSPVIDDAGTLVQYIGVQNDVTEQQDAREQAEFLAYRDALTGLANRALLKTFLDRAVDRAAEHGLEVALLYLDLNRFKDVNDDYGHAAGDDLLRTVASRLRAASRPGDLLVRHGGDEFVVVMADLGPQARAEAIGAAERLRAVISEPLTVGGHTARIRCSVGVSVLGKDAPDSGALLRHADAAMFRAKRTGRGVKLFQATGTADLRLSGQPERQPASAADAAELDRLITQDAVCAAYQPIVDLVSREVVAYEALARGPEGSALSSPAQLFATAAACERTGELDWTCRGAAVRGALEMRLGRSRKLFLNVEPLALGLPSPERLRELWGRAVDELDVVVEITERALTSRPAELLATVAQIRSRGWAIALDDVGADVRSLALMPLLHPDVIKLDLRLVQEQATTEIAEIVNAVNAESERTGAIVLAEGIETEAQLATARAMGATVGQGWLFGRPGPLPTLIDSPDVPLQIKPPVRVEVGRTPYKAVIAHRTPRRGDTRLLISVSMQLEEQAAALGESSVIVSAFQGAERFTPLTHRRYSLLAANAAFVAALGVGMSPEPAPGVRGAALHPDDPLLGEWSVVVLGPHFAAALVAIDLGDTCPLMQRRFDFALTYDRPLVIQAANALMTRITPLP